MSPESPSNNLFNLILENIVPILIILFLIISRLTKVKKTSEEPERTFDQTDNEEEDRVREALRHLIEERQSPHTQEYAQEHTPSSHPHHQAHADESVLTKTGSHFPVKSAAHTGTIKHTTPYTRAEAHVTEKTQHTLSYEDYSYQLAEQQQKIERARAIRKQIRSKELTSTSETTEVKPKTAARTLNQIFAKKSPLQQAILAKEILDQPLALRSKHLS